MAKFPPRRNHGCRLEVDTMLWGYRAVVLQNELLRITVLPGKGADIVEFLHKPTDTDFLWANPLSMRSPEMPVPPTQRTDGFGEFYPGGWQELFPHASVPIKIHGAEMYQHGEAWGLPWEVDVEEDSPKRITVRFTLRTRKMPFVLERRMTLVSGKPVVTFDETIHNRSGRKLDFMWGHHPAFGAPFLSEDCRLYAPTKKLALKEGKIRTSWPIGECKGKRRDFSKMLAPKSRAGGMFYLEELRQGWYALVNKKRKIGFGMSWDRKVFPVIWIWQEANATKGSPWFGEAYTMAVEPVSHFPFARERKEKLLTIPARGTFETRLKAFAIPGGKPVTSVRAYT